MLSEETLARGRDTDPDEPEVDQSLIPSQNGWTINYHGLEAAIKPDESQVTDIENVIHGSYSSLIVKSRSSTPVKWIRIRKRTSREKVDERFRVNYERRLLRSVTPNFDMEASSPPIVTRLTYTVR